jgi:thymidylate kinase
MKICFIGLDGSGKSTQANILVETLESDNVDVKYRHQFRYESASVMSAKNTLRPIIKRMQYLMCIPGSVLVDSRLLRMVRDNLLFRIVRPIFAYPLGFAVLYSGLVKAKGKDRKYGGHSVFVMDRSFVDEVARVEWKLSIQIPFKNYLFRIAPSPDLTFYFDIPGEQSWARMDPQDTKKGAMIYKEETYKRILTIFKSHTELHMLDIKRKQIGDVTEIVNKILKKSEFNPFSNPL